MATTPRRAPGHTDERFCNAPCGRCNDEIARRTARYQRRFTGEVRTLMRQVPVGR